MLRVIYGGSPQASAKALELILWDSEMSSQTPEQEYKIVGVLTNPPSAQGRHRDLIPTEVGHTAQIWNEARDAGIAILTPEHIREDERKQIEALHPDIFVCFAYGHILGPKFFALFRHGGINLHPSLLPKYRGATPVNQAILNCDSETGFSVQKMALGIDEGDVISEQKVTLTGTETAETLLKQCALYGASEITTILRNTARTGSLPNAKPQIGEASYCTIIKKEDGKINWKNSAEKIDAQIRAYTPWPGCFTSCNGVHTGTNYDHVRGLYQYHDSVDWGDWFVWGFFRCKAYKKGTMHFEFLDEDVWFKFNYEVSKLRGWELPKKSA